MGWGIRKEYAVDLVSRTMQHVGMEGKIGGMGGGIGSLNVFPVCHHWVHPKDFNLGSCI